MNDGESIHEHLIRTGRRVYRRRRKFQGASWTPPSMSAETEDGVWCKYCKKRHGYKNALDISFVPSFSQPGRWVILWECPVYGHTIKEQTL